MKTSTRGQQRCPFPAYFAGSLLLCVFACTPVKTPATKTPAEPPRSVGPELESLPPLHVLQKLRGSEAERRACFDVSGESRRGFVKLAWRVTTEGRAEDVRVEGTSVHHQEVEQCLAEAVKVMDFGPRAEPVQARWVFVHQLPKMPGVEQVIEAKRKQKQKRKKKDAEAQDDVAGVSIEDASKGSLELQRIEDIVHAGFPLFAYCYRSGLERDPGLGGLVRLRFVIDEEGAVMGVMDSGSEFGDRHALDCMAEGIFALDFPPPAGGDVRVQYRIVFESS